MMSIAAPHFQAFSILRYDDDSTFSCHFNRLKREIASMINTSSMIEIVSNVFRRHQAQVMAGGTGFEPVLAESESAVLPLDDPPFEIGDVDTKLDYTSLQKITFFAY